MQGCVIYCGTVVFFKKSHNLSRLLLTNNNFYCDLLGGNHMLVKKTDYMKLKEQREKEKAEQERTTARPIFHCSDLRLGQFLAPGEPRQILMTGFPKSGAMWFKSVADTILPYYYWIVEKSLVRIDKTECTYIHLPRENMNLPYSIRMYSGTSSRWTRRLWLNFLIFLYE